jgi:3-hydroxyacyl-CoA dehydrogenase
MSVADQINATVSLYHAENVAVITIASPPVNALSELVRDGLSEALRIADEGPDAAVIVICDGRTFVAGADITEFGAPIKGVNLRDLNLQLEKMSKPVVMALHGTALGGGLELALSAHYRVAVPSTRIGLPEVKLGLLPGAGGTQRLPRLAGVEKALEIMTSGRMVPAAEAVQLDIIDSLVEEKDLLGGALSFARNVVQSGGALPLVRDQAGGLVAARDNPGLFDAFRKANARKFGRLEAPEAIIRCVEAAVSSSDFETGLAEEARMFEALLDGAQSAAQRYYFFAERDAAKVPGLGPDVQPRPFAKIGIVGAGLMGGGIAMNFASIGIPVIIADVTPSGLERGLATIRNNYERTAKRKGLGAEFVDGAMSNISGTVDLADLAACDLVIEAAFERMDVKLGIFAQLDAVCKPGAILATNTSALDIDEIAAATSRPKDVIGLHFFSPANVMRLLEVVRGAATASDVIATTMKLSGKIGKIAVLSGVCDGFIGNRMLFARQDQASELVLEGALPWDIDRVLVDFGFPMGPFALDDLAGLDLGWVQPESSGKTLKEVMCEAGRFGQKSSGGYYDYDDSRRATPSAAAADIIAAFVARQGKPQRIFSDQEILERCLYAMINEGAKILDEGIAMRASDIDVVWVNGYGWPVYLGGPMYHAEQIGLGRVLAGLRRFAADNVPGIAVSPLLERLVAEGRSFSTVRAE